MLLVIDIGNTRTKWGLTDDNGELQNMQTCLNAEVASSNLKSVLKTAKKIWVANVAGEAMAQQITKLAGAKAQITFASAAPQACGVVNHYQTPHTLGIDRWAAIVAAWHMNKKPVLIVNAGTAITIDAVSKEVVGGAATGNGVFLGGTIMPGLRLMQESLGNNTAQLGLLHGAASVQVFPTNTQDAIYNGNLNAALGAINMMLQALEKHCAYLPKLMISGGDANKIAESLRPLLKRIIIADNLVLQGLVLLQKESV